MDVFTVLTLNSTLKKNSFASTFCEEETHFFVKEEKQLYACCYLQLQVYVNIGKTHSQSIL